MLRFWIALVVLITPAGLFADDWPQWRGPNRDNLSNETGLLQEWPPEGPPLLWKAEGLGEGVPSVSVAGGRVFVLGYHDDKEFLTAVHEKDGTSAWSVPVGPAVKEIPSMRWLSQRTPTVDGERVYAFTARGELICLSTADGKEQWRVDYVKDFDGKRNVWGYCDFPLVDGDHLICTPGGTTATLAALDKKTGAVVWKSVVPMTPRGTYGGVVVAEIGGIRQYIHQLDNGVVGIAAADGKLLWNYADLKPGQGNVHTALIKDDEVFVSCGWGVGAALLKLSGDGSTVKGDLIYKAKLGFDSWLGSSVHLGDYVHAANGFCAEWKTGQKVVQPNRTPHGRLTMTCADGHLYYRNEANVTTLVEVSDKGEYVVKGELKSIRQSTEPGWSFPVVANGRLYLRDQDVLLCYDLREKKTKLEEPDVIFVPTPQDVVDKMLELAAVAKGDVVADLGCGDGRIVIAAAKQYGCHAVGYDIDPDCVELARAGVKKADVAELVRIENRNMFKVDLSGVSVATLFLSPALNGRLVPQLEKMKPGSRIVSHSFDMSGYKPDKVISFKSAEDGVSHKLYLWTVPLKTDSAK